MPRCAMGNSLSRWDGEFGEEETLPSPEKKKQGTMDLHVVVFELNGLWKMI